MPKAPLRGGGRVETRFKVRVKGDDLLLGIWVSTCDPMMAEAVALADVDFLILDTEHAPLTASDVLMHQIVADSARCPLLVRIGADEPVGYMLALDGGATGVVVPRVKTAEDVQRAIDYSYYPPMGSRGFGPRRVSAYFRDVDAYVETANEFTTVIVQIETREAVDNLDAILAIPGLDGILVGRNDLAGSLGLSRDPNDGALAEVSRQILTAARQAGLGRGIACSAHAAAIPPLRDLGATMIAAGIDVEYLARAVDSFLLEARPTIG